MNRRNLVCCIPESSNLLQLVSEHTGDQAQTHPSIVKIVKAAQEIGNFNHEVVPQNVLQFWISLAIKCIDTVFEIMEHCHPNWVNESQTLEERGTLFSVER